MTSKGPGGVGTPDGGTAGAGALEGGLLESTRELMS